MTNNNQHIPSGYKSSPLGIIPENWEVKRLKETGEIYSGGTPSTDIQEYWNGNIDWCTPTDITSLNGAMYINKTAQKITENGLKNSSAVLMPPNSIIVCTRATIGNAAISLHQISTNQGFKNIVPNKDIDFIFLYYTIINNKTRLIRLGNGSTFLEVSKSDFENLTIPVPPLPEQHRIVSVLSLWDSAISKQTAMIEKLTLRKRGLMQQLLTGKKRLKGFGGEWKDVRLGDVFEERNETNCDNLPLLSITGDKGVIYQSESDKRDISNEDKSKYKRICPNDIGYNTMRMWQGRSALSELEGIVSPAYTIVTPKNSIDVRFMAMLIQQPRVVYSFWTHSQGLVSDTLNCKYPDFCQVKVTIPSKYEQTAIADFFIGLNKEIEMANKKLARLQEEKKGLMQVLLTGKKRIK